MFNINLNMYKSPKLLGKLQKPLICLALCQIESSVFSVLITFCGFKVFFFFDCCILSHISKVVYLFDLSCEKICSLNIHL